jgi:hypothetical protein
MQTFKQHLTEMALGKFWDKLSTTYKVSREDVKKAWEEAGEHLSSNTIENFDNYIVALEAETVKRVKALAH